MFWLPYFTCSWLLQLAAPPPRAGRASRCSASASSIVRLTRTFDATPPRNDWPGIDGQQVGAQRVDPVLDRLLGAGAQRHHGDDRADADDDAEHGERRPELVGADGLEAPPPTVSPISMVSGLLRRAG